MSKHTPGPWDIHTTDRGFEIHPLSDQDGLIVIADVQEEDNAILIAETPALLAALEALDKWLATEFPPAALDRAENAKRVSLLRFARAAIRRAKGEA